MAADDMDPAEFVQRIRQLGEQRDQQDDARVKKLQDELIQGRSERLARRAERARSISPDKPGTPGTPGTPASALAPVAMAESPARDRDQDRQDSLQRLSASPAPSPAAAPVATLEDLEPKKPAASAAALGRSGTLSWKQRPQSGSIRRPLSMSPTRADRAPATPPPLAAASPDKFAERSSFASIMDPEVNSPPSDSLRSSSPVSRESPIRGSAMLSNRFSNTTSVSGGQPEASPKRGSALPILDSQRFAPPAEADTMAEEGDSTRMARAMAMSPTQGRISPERERSTSPTKGMGGFVQSAMLKRSDSVSKRWSTVTPPGLARQSSTLSNRGSAIAGYGTLSKLDRPNRSRDNSTEPSSRPSSSHSSATITRPATVDEDRVPREFVKPALPAQSRHSRSKSVASTFSEKDQLQDDMSPASPSKRWSPTKSSWLESALSKPDSPKVMKQPPPAQPAWMAELSRIKQQRGSVDFGKGGPLHSPSGDTSTSSQPSSPIKDVQLKPLGFRRPDSPKKEETSADKSTTPNRDRGESLLESSPKLRPMLLAGKVSQKESGNSSEDIASLEEQSKALAATPPPHTDASLSKHAAKPSLTSRVSAPLLSSDRPVASRFAQDTGLAVANSKPVEPPKDFRAGLKSRQPAGETPKKPEGVNEFHNVFGKLRKAETKNYVAPDVLKDNITRGKNALNVTGGPKPTERRDEFRESLRHRKSVILEKAKEEGSVLKRSSSSSDVLPTPEAIAKRGVLNRAESGSKAIIPPKEDSTPEALARKKSLRTLAQPTVKDKSLQPAPLFAAKTSGLSSKLAGRFDPGLAGMLARGPPAMANKTLASTTDADMSSARPVQEEKSGPAPELQHITKGRARGPKRRAPKQTTAGIVQTEDNMTTSRAAVSPVKPEQVISCPEPSKTNGQPEARTMASTLVRQSSTNNKPATPAKSSRITSGKFTKTTTPELPKKPTSVELDRRASGSQASAKISPRSVSMGSPKPLSPEVPKKPSSLEADRRLSGSYQTPTKPPMNTVVESPKTVSPSSSPVLNKSRFSRPLPTLPTQSSVKSSHPTPLKDISTPNAEISSVRDVPSPDKPTLVSVKNATSMWDRQSASSPPTPARSKSPIKLPTRADEQAAMQNAGLIREPEQKPKPLPNLPRAEPQTPVISKQHSVAASKPLPSKPMPTGLGFGLGSFGNLVASRSREPSELIPINKAESSPPHTSHAQLEPVKASPNTHCPEKRDGMFSDFFDDAPITSGQLPDHIDTAHVLKSPLLTIGPANRIRTLRKEIQKVNSDGRLSPVPQHEEHVLYQDSMYICTHVYDDCKSSKFTDIYLWAGNGVAEPNVEDAQLFAKNHARRNQANLVILRQGQEPPNFFEALGGIVVTRRGTETTSKDFMLCGRRHLGHLAFDEVDFSLKSLCSAFPYLISTADDRVLLWKGRGCSAEELSGARLMGMDLALTGDFTEIDEGNEPRSFLAVFPLSDLPAKGPAIPRSADHWRYKATNDKYHARLFRVEQSTSTQSVTWGSALQASSSFLAPLLRRPSWNGGAVGANNTEQRPQTPRTPPPPANATSSNIKTDIKEIMPFCQRDLEPENIYVLDAFFEIYIIVGPLSRTQAPAFATALLFAQEYAMISVSEQDRPFIPVTTIILEGVPRDMKAVFRHWDDARIPAAGLMRGKLGRGKSLRIVGLEKAMEETRR